CRTTSSLYRCCHHRAHHSFPTRRSSDLITTVAAIQASFSRDMQANIDKMAHYIEMAAKQGAHVILAPELFQNLYFCTQQREEWLDRKSTRLNSSHVSISYAVFCLKKKKQ